ncbi:phosphoglycolate phosphatase [Roseivivax marinus]|uniref:phosphoglycolate phosphatase n=1 Tax=Roseivivax marinus TaxID=1379903 RepID=UPI001F044E28|nr:phosphoglycolate phosphatase [Roseivivax marinus]UMA65060.1 phosphoglycolate phosphatase [Roseivivax marinus]
MARIVFDLDGTLIDSAPDIRRVANGVLAGVGAEKLSLEETVSFIGDGAGVFVQRMRAARGIPDADHEAMHAAFLDRYSDAHDLTTPYPGAVAALELLRERGHRLAICTNKPAGPARAILEHLDLLAHFEALIGGDSLPQRKPDPAPLRAAAEVLGGEDAVLYVGDSEVDAATAQAAGLPFALFSGGYRKTEIATIPHTVTFDNHADLPALLCGMLA